MNGRENAWWPTWRLFFSSRNQEGRQMILMAGQRMGFQLWWLSYGNIHGVNKVIERLWVGGMIGNKLIYWPLSCTWRPETVRWHVLFVPTELNWAIVTVGNILLEQLKKIIFMHYHLHTWFSLPTLVKTTVFKSTAMHFLDHSLHNILFLGVRESLLIILSTEDILPMASLRVVYALFGSCWLGVYIYIYLHSAWRVSFEISCHKIWFQVSCTFAWWIQ